VKLSVLIVTWNSASDIEACIDSIHFGSEFEVIVVDNASTDATRDKLGGIITCNSSQQLEPRLRRANNQGIKLATGEYVLLLNPDTRVELRRARHARSPSGRTPAVARSRRGWSALTARPSSQSLFPTAASLFWELVGLARIFPKNRIFGRWKMKYFDYERSAEVDQPMASCLMLRRTILNSLVPGPSSLVPSPSSLVPCVMDERFRYSSTTSTSPSGWPTPAGRRLHRQRESGPSPRREHEAGPAEDDRESHRSAFGYLRKHDHSGLFWLKAIVLLPLFEVTSLLRVIAYRLRRRA